jgi:hypothetical protein
MTDELDIGSGGGERAALGARSIATELYWILPTPRAFVEAVAAALATERALLLRLPAIAVTGLHRAVENALERVHLGATYRRWLKIEDGMNVATQIGAALGMKPISAEELALIEQAPARAIIVEAMSGNAARNCAEYVSRFTAALPASEPHGGARLLALIPEELEGIEPALANGIREIRFSGALSKEEMAAYVAVRMTERRGPANTGLLRNLVTEFAGFDAQFAEELVAFSDEALLALPLTLESLAAQADSRWRSGRWAALCYADLSGKRMRHTLYEVQLSRHAGPEQREAEEALRRKYWRACVRSLLPYLEEHRSSVMAPLRAALKAHASKTGGKLVRPTLTGKRVETTSIDDVEYNQIPGLIYHEQFRVPADPKANQAVEICYAAKTVRDELAHMRAPRPEAILKMTTSMDRLLSG